MDLQSTWPLTPKDKPKPEIRDLRLSQRSKLVTLLEIPFQDRSGAEVKKIRALVALARAVFVIWLGAVKELSNPAMKELVPWEEGTINYRGLADHSFLARNFSDPEALRGKREELKAYEEWSRIRFMEWH